MITIHCDCEGCERTQELPASGALPEGWASIAWVAEIPGKTHEQVLIFSKMVHKVAKKRPDDPVLQSVAEGIDDYQPPPQKASFRATICDECLKHKVPLARTTMDQGMVL